MQFLKGKSIFKKREACAYSVYGSHECNPYNFESFAGKGFSNNAIVYRAISLIARSMASVEFDVNDDRNPKLAAQISAFLANPCESYDTARILDAITTYLLIAGNSYMYLSNEYPFSMQVLRPDRVEIVPTRDKTSVDHYIYRTHEGSVAITDVNNVIHLKFFNPMSDWYGLSPLQAAAKSVDQHTAVSEHNLSILKNGGRPSGCLVLRNGADNLTDRQREQLMDGIRESYSGTNNAGRVMILEGDFEWKDLSKSPKDLDFFLGKNISAREIAQVFGIPPMLIGIQGDSTFSNYREARYHLWEDTILPILNQFIAAFNKWLYENVSTSIKIGVNMDKISALSFKRDQLWKRVSDCNFLTIDEKRAFLGYPPMNAS